ncbi:hypothetical protein GF359_07860 [candidate division WOR-3 bacterium]|uniref:Insulinase family protein n=1 Tax=candidate division WOR-3 bacterium TaxID=2052148 RepID=A0A9D5QEK2_UNCW3|nr:hypothetical protein [candidate division WOR-3 bacterium]MBD3365115.1 hypothetical protein [candidate division WOR-3 bacterium]
MIKKVSITFFLTLLTLSAGKVKLEDPREMDFSDDTPFIPQEVEQETLSNGITVFLAENHELPLVDVFIAVRAGEVRVPAAEAGFAEILAYIIVEGGSNKIKTRAFRDSLENLGATFRAEPGSKYTDFSLHILSKHLPALLPLAVEAIRFPGLPQEQLEINKKQYLSSYQGRNNDPYSVASRIYWKLIYGRDSPAAREVTPSSLNKITEESLGDFHSANYRPSHVIVGVSGDFRKAEILELLETCLGNWEEPSVNPDPELDMITETAEPGIYLVNWPGAVQTNIWMGYLSFKRDDERYPNALLFTEIYGASRFSRMRLVVREKHGLAYSPYGWVSGGLTVPGTFSTVVGTKSSTTLKALNLLNVIIEDLRTQGVTEEDLTIAKESWLSAFPAHYSQTTKVIKDRMLYYRYSYPVNFWDMLPEKIKPLTQADMGGFASGFLEPSQLRILVVGDTSSFDGSIAEFGAFKVLDPSEY